MLAELLERGAHLSRSQLLWALLSALVVGQLVAFWMLCSHQVHQAQVRDATVQVIKTQTKGSAS